MGDTKTIKPFALKGHGSIALLASSRGLLTLSHFGLWVQLLNSLNLQKILTLKGDKSLLSDLIYTDAPAQERTPHIAQKCYVGNLGKGGYKINCSIARLSLNKMSTVIG